MRLSKSSPPRWVSPAVALTLKVPFDIVRMETSQAIGNGGSSGLIDDADDIEAVNGTDILGGLSLRVAKLSLGFSMNCASRLLSVDLACSPSLTESLIDDWLSTFVYNVRSFWVGTVVFCGTTTYMASPTVCTPSERGVTSRSTRSLTLSSPMPRRTAVCTAVPDAIASSGLMLLHSSFPSKINCSIF
ncbi:NAD-specific glutamate dehydrogenase [Striga asiatica]|uniref:NAD-specific glutamate dehydrogenase n=1 Tax=Striga asiatica TaxID=4170 RepID=A0A5A7Q713_STRAF|nr:NAD-specific glutamate dehydrogenase [Striga asiatica]